MGRTLKQEPRKLNTGQGGPFSGFRHQREARHSYCIVPARRLVPGRAAPAHVAAVMNPAGLARQTVAGGTDSGADRVLADALERVLRHPADKMALVLHLSRLPPPAPHPHHLRVANALMQDCAARFDGQVLGLPAQDMMLIATMPKDPSPAAQAASPVQLRETLSRLFAADMPDQGALTSLWRIDEDPRAFASFVGDAGAALAAQAKTVQLPAEIPASARSLLALEDVVAQIPLADLVRRQTGMFLDPDRKQNLAKRLKPAFRALQLSLRPLNLRAEATEALADPYLRQNFYTKLDTQLLNLLHDDLRGPRQFFHGVQGGGRMHITLNLDALLTRGFARLSRLASECGVRFAVQIALMPAMLGIELLERARKMMSLAGVDLVIGPVDAAELGLAAPDRLNPTHVRIAWSPHLADLVAERQSPAARNFACIPPARIILQGADSEQAVAWGQAQGISLYQGRFLEMAGAAARMEGCFAAAGCTVRQCAERAVSTSKAGRLGCLNTALLDAIEVAAQ